MKTKQKKEGSPQVVHTHMLNPELVEKIKLLEKLILKNYNLTKEELNSRTKKWNVAYPRFVLNYIAHMHLHMSCLLIARYYSREYNSIRESVGRVSELGLLGDVKKIVELMESQSNG